MEMVPVPADIVDWESYSEDISTLGSSTITAVRLVDQLNMTIDTTDYLWYKTRYYFLTLSSLENHHEEAISGCSCKCSIFFLKK